MLSLNLRLLLAALLVLVAFLGMTGWVLDRAFSSSAESAVQERLQGQIYALIAASEVQRDGTMVMPAELPEPRFATPGSGLYAQVAANSGAQRWRSHSAVGLDIPFPTELSRGENRFLKVRNSTGTELYTFSFGLSWEARGKEWAYTFSVAESLDGFRRQVASFRNNLFGWLLGLGVALLAVQGTILRWGLAPLRRVAAELRAVEKGDTTHLSGRYPKELIGLTTNLNAFIKSERDNLLRYRNSLSDLAHSLKTPLAVLRTEIDNLPSGTPRETCHEHLERIRQAVDYQLQRGSASGRTALVTPVDLAALSQRIINSLNKVYADKQVAAEIHMETQILLRMEQGDVLEFLGNMLDNAYKWAKSQVRVTAQRQPGLGRRKGVVILIEDDGPGIPDEKLRDILQRGVRADETVPGQGIGLAVAREIIQIYGGQLEVGRSRLGGAKFTATLPEFNETANQGGEPR